MRRWSFGKPKTADFFAFSFGFLHLFGHTGTFPRKKNAKEKALVLSFSIVVCFLFTSAFFFFFCLPPRCPQPRGAPGSKPKAC